MHQERKQKGKDKSRAQKIKGSSRRLQIARGLGGKGGSKKTRVDIMVLYTEQAMCAHAGQPVGCPATKDNRKAIEAEAKLNVAISNVAFAQSGIKR
jgi:hypothetical protein